MEVFTKFAGRSLRQRVGNSLNPVYANGLGVARYVNDSVENDSIANRPLGPSVPSLSAESAWSVESFRDGFCCENCYEPSFQPQ